MSVVATVVFSIRFNHHAEEASPEFSIKR